MADNFKLGAISVVMLGVQDVQRSLKFYRDVLGLKLATQFESFAFFETGSATLVLSEGLARHTGQGAGATEVVFNVDGVREHYQTLVDRGVTFIQAPRVATGTQWVANFQDPDGHRLSIFGAEHRSQAASG